MSRGEMCNKPNSLLYLLIKAISSFQGSEWLESRRWRDRELVWLRNGRERGGGIDRLARSALASVVPGSDCLLLRLAALVGGTEVCADGGRL